MRSFPERERERDARSHAVGVLSSPLGDVRAPPGDGHGVFSTAAGMILVVEDAVLAGELPDGLLAALWTSRTSTEQRGSSQCQDRASITLAFRYSEQFNKSVANKHVKRADQ